MTTIEQLRALAKSYRLNFSGKIYNDFRLKHNRIRMPTQRAGLCPRVQNEHPTAKVEFKNYRPYTPAGDIIISFKK